ncbi:MAG: hypothetical protein KAY32_01700 [Candidatus Eisenbacteria sp.]|nr:hypothetical protein [Candidatus Eisenbacteria bacterium]
MSCALIPEAAKYVMGIEPKTHGGAETGDYVSCKTAHAVYMVCKVAQGNAAQITWTPKQATAVAGTSSKALGTVVPIWSNEDTAASDALTAETAAVNFQTDAALKNKVVIFKIDPATLDKANGFDCVCMYAAASNAANLISVDYYLEARYGHGETAITD